MTMSYIGRDTTVLALCLLATYVERFLPVDKNYAI